MPEIITYRTKKYVIFIYYDDNLLKQIINQKWKLIGECNNDETFIIIDEYYNIIHNFIRIAYFACSLASYKLFAMAN